MKYQKIKLSLDSKIDGTVSVNGHEDIFNFLVAAEKSGDFKKGQEVVVRELEKVFEHNKKVLNAVTGINFELMYEFMVNRCKKLTSEELNEYATDISHYWDIFCHGDYSQRPAEFYIFNDFFGNASVFSSWQMNIFNIIFGYIELDPDILFLKSFKSFKNKSDEIFEFIANASSLRVGCDARLLLKEENVAVDKIFQKTYIYMNKSDISLYEVIDGLSFKTIAIYKKKSYELTFFINLDMTEELLKDSAYWRLVEDIKKDTEGDLTRFTLDSFDDFELSFLLRQFHSDHIDDYGHFSSIIEKIKNANKALDALSLGVANGYSQRRNQTNAL